MISPSSDFAASNLSCNQNWGESELDSLAGNARLSVAS